VGTKVKKGARQGTAGGAITIQSQDAGRLSAASAKQWMDQKSVIMLFC